MYQLHLNTETIKQTIYFTRIVHISHTVYRIFIWFTFQNTHDIRAIAAEFTMHHDNSSKSIHLNEVLLFQWQSNR